MSNTFAAPPVLQPSAGFGMPTMPAAQVPIRPTMPTDPRLQTQQQQAATGAPQTADEREKAELIRKVLELTDEQIEQLPADQRTPVIMLRQQLRAHGQI